MPLVLQERNSGIHDERDEGRAIRRARPGRLWLGQLHRDEPLAVESGWAKL